MLTAAEYMRHARSNFIISFEIPLPLDPKIIIIMIGLQILEGGKDMSKFLAAACQMDSQNDKEMNLKTAGALVDEAAGRGARLVVFPEMMNFMGSCK